VNLATVQDRLYDTLAKSSAGRRGALWVRNIATQVLAHRLAPTIDPDRNGEAMLQRDLAPSLRTVIDVGANRGEWTASVLANAVGLERVLCYEPSSTALAALSERFGADSRVEVVAAAVSDKPGEQDFFEEPQAGETSSLLGSHSNQHAQRRSVPVVTIDDEMSRCQLAHVDLLKIDAEGMDLHVLRGGQHALAEHRIGVAQFEYNAPWASAGSTLAAAFNLLNGHGYEVFALLPDGLRQFDPSRIGELFVYSNFVALSPDLMDRFRAGIGPPVL
jgi:FkbM family methyltransferase